MTQDTNEPSGASGGYRDAIDIYDAGGRRLKIGMRVGCRRANQPRECSVRGLTLLGYDEHSDEPYITNGGRFAIALIDHQPSMDDWIARYVR